jgi:hypothetical protein
VVSPIRDTRFVELIHGGVNAHPGRRQERVWIAQRPKAQSTLIATSASDRDRTGAI